MEEEKRLEEKKKTTLGIDEDIEGLLCYVLGFISGVVFLLIEKDNKFVRFHAMQSTVVFLSLFIIGMVLWLIPFIGWLLGTLLFVLELFLWLFLMFKAYSGEKYKLPIAGDIAERETG